MANRSPRGAGSGTVSSVASPSRWRNVFDRLADPATFTGVYAERFKSGPGINHDADVKLHSHRSAFEGSTNTGTDEQIRDIKYITRPNLNRDRQDATSPFGRATMKVQQRYKAAEEALLQHLLVQTGGGPSVYVLPASGTAPISSSASVGPYDSASQIGGEGLHGFGAEHHQTVAIKPDEPIDTNVQLQLLFQYYCRFGRTGGSGEDSDTLDSFNFAKFAKECPDLLDRRLNLTEIDLIFVKSKAKNGRRLNYGEWLDALARMASVKFEAVEEPSQAFAMLLTQHVFTNPACVGIAQAVRSGLIRVETTASQWTLGASSSSGPVDPQAVVQSAASPSAAPRPTAAGPFSAAAAAAGLSPRNRTRAVSGAVSSPAAAVFSAPVPVAGIAQPGSPSRAGSVVGGHTGSPRPASAMASMMAAAPSPGSFPVSGGTASIAVPSGAPPSDIYDVIARKALEIQLQAAAAAAQAGSRSPAGAAMPTQVIAVDPAVIAAAARSMGIQLPTSSSPAQAGPVSARGLGGSPASGLGQRPASASPASTSQRRGRGSIGDASVLSGPSVPIAGAVVRTSSPTFRGFAQAGHPDHPVNAGLSSVGAGAVGGGLHQGAASVFSGGSSVVGPAGGAGGRPRSASQSLSRSPSRAGSVSPKRPGYGEPGFRPTIPGEAIKPGGVYDRLTDPEAFTGVYKRAWFTDGRINQASDTGVSARPTSFNGHTNTGTNETIHDISHMLRPNLTSTEGRPAFKP